MEPNKGLKGGPIIARPNSPTQRLNSLLGKFLSTVLPKLKSFIKDDKDIFKKLATSLDQTFHF